MTPGRLAREPLLHFLLLGAALFALDHWRRERAPAEAAREIRVTSAQRAELVDGFTRAQGRAPSADEAERLVQGWIDEEILYREGLARGLEQGDARVRKRVAEKMGFVVEAQGVVPEPGEAELRGWFDGHPERWALPARFDFTHVFVREGGEARARALLARLAAGEAPAGMGDVFPGGRHYRGRRLEDVEAAFGPELASGLAEQPDGAWTLRRSRHGLHLVRVDLRTAARAPTFEESRALVREDWLAARRRQAANAALETLRARWRVVRE